MNFEKIRYLVVEDIENTAKELMSEIAQHQSTSLVDWADTVPAAFKLYQKTKHDILFLDINLRNSNGYELLQEIKLNYSKLPYTVIVTGEESGAKDFSLQFSDYHPYIQFFWQKPILSDIQEKLDRIIHKIKQSPLQPTTTFIQINGTERCAVKNITHLQANGSYTNVYLDNIVKPKISTKPLKYFIDKLPQYTQDPSQGFIQTNRSFLVNKAYIAGYKSKKKGGQCQLLNSGIMVPISESYLKPFKIAVGFL